MRRVERDGEILKVHEQVKVSEFKTITERSVKRSVSIEPVSHGEVEYVTPEIGRMLNEHVPEVRTDVTVVADPEQFPDSWDEFGVEKPKNLSWRVTPRDIANAVSTSSTVSEVKDKVNGSSYEMVKRALNRMELLDEVDSLNGNEIRRKY